MTFYVIPRNADITSCGEGTQHPEAKPFNTFGEAKKYAEKLHASFGTHWHVVKVETAWVTTTLADIMAERKAK